MSNSSQNNELEKISFFLRKKIIEISYLDCHHLQI